MLDTILTLVSTNNSCSWHHYPKFIDEETEPLNKWIKVADQGPELGLKPWFTGLHNLSTVLGY